MSRLRKHDITENYCTRFITSLREQAILLPNFVVQMTQIITPARFNIEHHGTNNSPRNIG